MLRFYKKKQSSFGLKFAFGVSLLVFISCAVLIGVYMFDSYKNKDKQNKISDLIDGINVINDNGVLVDRYKDIRDKYPDLAGRLIIHNDGAAGNILNKLVVMHTPSEPDKYLYKDSEGNHSDFGTAYLDYECSIEYTTDNYIIYAHNMKNLTQFGCLRYYKQRSYWEKYPTVEFETMYDEPTDYEIFAAFYSQIYRVGDEVFKYYKFKDANSKEEFDDYISNVKKLSLYDTGITPEYGEQLLTMTTCDYSRVKEVGRFVVVARKKTGRIPGNNKLVKPVVGDEEAVEDILSSGETEAPTQNATQRPVSLQTVAPTTTPTKTPIPDQVIKTPEPEVTNEEEVSESENPSEEPIMTHVP